MLWSVSSWRIQAWRSRSILTLDKYECVFRFKIFFPQSENSLKMLLKKLSQEISMCYVCICFYIYFFFSKEVCLQKPGYWSNTKLSCLLYSTCIIQCLTFFLHCFQMILCGMGELHIEIIHDRIRREYGLETYLGPLQIAYRETILSASQASGTVP